MTVNRIGPLHIFGIERRTLSTNGNPRFTLYTDYGTFQTQSDAALRDSIENYANSRRADTYAIGDDAPAVTLIATKANKVYAIEKDGELLH